MAKQAEANKIAHELSREPITTVAGIDIYLYPGFKTARPQFKIKSNYYSTLTEAVDAARRFSQSNKKLKEPIKALYSRGTILEDVLITGIDYFRQEVTVLREDGVDQVFFYQVSRVLFSPTEDNRKRLQQRQRIRKMIKDLEDELRTITRLEAINIDRKEVA